MDVTVLLLYCQKRPATEWGNQWRIINLSQTPELFFVHAEQQKWHISYTSGGNKPSHFLYCCTIPVKQFNLYLFHLFNTSPSQLPICIFKLLMEWIKNKRKKIERGRQLKTHFPVKRRSFLTIFSGPSVSQENNCCSKGMCWITFPSSWNTLLLINTDSEILPWVHSTNTFHFPFFEKPRVWDKLQQVWKS